MGFMKGRHLREIASDAKSAFKQGDMRFTTGFDLNPYARVDMKRIRQGMDEVIAIVEPVGWKYASVETFLASVMLTFVRV